MESKCMLLLACLAAQSAMPAEPMFAYRSFDPELEETARFARLGVPMRAFGVCNTHAGNGNWYGAYPMVWKGPGVYAWENLDRQVADILAASPDAQLFCLVDLNSPPWLQRKMHFDSFDSISSAACSPLWRSRVREWLPAVIRHCEGKWGGRIKAYALMAGQTTEWFETDFSRTSRDKNGAWRRWCAERGFDGGTSVPDEVELGRAAFEGVVYDPSSERRKVEFWRFHNSVVADAVLECARAAKSLAPGKQIGAFFGYFNICNKSLASQCHLAYERVAASPDIDFLLSPATYSHRACGQPTRTMTVPATLRRHGKRFMHEIDFWPHTKKVWFTRPNEWKTAEDTIAGNTREAAYAIANHASFWWFDQKGGFYDVPGMHERIGKLMEIARRYADDDSPLLADVLVVDDPDSAYGAVDKTAARKSPDDGRLQPTLGVGEELPARIGRLSVGLDICSFEDLPHVDMERVKVVVLPGVWTIDAHKAEILRRHVLGKGRTVIWTYAPGVSDGKTLDAARVAEWTGFGFGTPDVGVRKMDGWTSVYAYDYRLLTTERLGGILRDAGCHFWTDECLPVSANARFAAIHAKTGGERTVRLPSRCARVVNLLTDEVLGENVDSVRVSFGSPDTVLLGLEQARDAACAASARDALLPAADGDARLLGPVGAKLDRLVDHRVRSDFAKTVVFPEARSAFEKPDDDIFNKRPELKRPLGMWKGEFWGKLMISACRMAGYTHDAGLREFLHEEAMRLMAFQRPDGYLGTYVDPEYVQPQDWQQNGRDTTVKAKWCWNLWCRKYTMWGLLMNWRLTGDARVLDAVRRSMDQEMEMLDRLGLHPCDTGTFMGMPSSSVLKPLLMLYEATRERRYLDFAKRIVDDFRRDDGRAPNLVANAFSGRAVADWYEAPWAWAKVYEMLSCLDGLLEYWRVTGDESVLEAMKRVQAMLAEHETNPLFSVGYNDQLAWAARQYDGVTEPCDAIHWIRFNLDLFTITGETRYADAMELAFYNAYLAGVFRDGTWGGRAVRSHTYHHGVSGGQSGMSHQHCCVNNLPRTVADIASAVATRARDGALCVAFYGDATASVDGDSVEISGNYPYGDAVTVKVVKAKPGKVLFRIPAWSASSVDRGTWRTVDAPAGESTYSLAFDMRPRLFDPVRDAPSPSVRNGRAQSNWREVMFTAYNRNPDVQQFMRPEPAAEIMRGPLLLAKAEVVGTPAEEIAASSLHGKRPKLALEPLSADGVVSAWTLTIGEGRDAKRMPVCDFPSAGDKYETGGMRFSVWF